MHINWWVERAGRLGHAVCLRRATEWFPVSRRSQPFMIELRTLGGPDLRGGDGRALGSILAQPKRFALLVHLVLGDGGRDGCGTLRRDSLLGILWPDLDQERGRAALRKALHHLRRALGEDALAGFGDEVVGVAEGALRCDAIEFERALDAGRPEDAMALYRGDLLEGFFLSDAAEFERWSERERSRLRLRAVAGAWALSEGAEARGEAAGALAWARRALDLSDRDELVLQQVLSLHDRLGDRVGGVRAYEEYRRYLEAEYGLDPSAETEDLVRAIRERRATGEGPARRVSDPVSPEEGTIAAAPREAAEPGSREPVAPIRPSVAAQPVRMRRGDEGRARGWIGAGAVAAVVTAIALAASGSWKDPSPASATVAVGKIEDYASQEGPGLAPALGDMLATNLARVPGLRVVSNARLYEVLGQSGETELSAATMARSARGAGATEVVDGALYRLSNGALRFDLRSVELASGEVRAAYTVEGTDLFAVVDEATAAFASGVGIRVEGLRIADVTTGSLVAYRLYEEGLRALYQRGDGRAAFELFAAALEEDSTFAMAAWYAGVSPPSGVPYQPYRDRAARMAPRASDRERLMILAGWKSGMMEPSALAVAETLAVRYPDEPDGHYWLGLHRVWSGEFLEGVEDLRRVVKMDSLSLAGKSPRCRACDALAQIVEAYLLEDSFPAAERTAREFTRLRPESAAAWSTLSRVLDLDGRGEEALTAFRTALRFSAAAPLTEVEAIVALRAGNFPRVDSLLLPFVREPDPQLRGRPLWFHIISLRSQGRLQEALAAAESARHDFERLAEAQGLPASQRIHGALPEATVLFESGHSREAAALFERMANSPTVEPWRKGAVARHRAWHLTHVGAALAAAGDTARVAALADSVQSIGRESRYGRDRRLHHHLRGLVALARGREPEAEAEFRRAIFSPTLGYTRTNLELGRLLLKQGRPREAIAVLRPSLRGSLEASNLYVTRTELHELLAEAFAAAGIADSASTHFRWVADAWKEADPSFDARRAAALRRWRELESGRREPVPGPRNAGR